MVSRLHLLLLAVPCSGRALVAPQRPSLEPLLEPARRLNEQLREVSADLRRRVLGHSGAQAGEQPVFAGSWTTDRVENLDEFLDRAMGVGYMKRKIAAKASQSQRLYQAGPVVHLEITDRRGTMKYELRPDGRVVSGRGFMKLPIKQQCKWGKGGCILMEERYSQHLGGALSGKPCSGSSCPVVRSCRSVTAKGQMLVEVERTLIDGETLRMRTFYRRLPQRESTR